MKLCQFSKLYFCNYECQILIVLLTYKLVLFICAPSIFMVLRPDVHPNPPSYISVWSQGDTRHYLAIAKVGYTANNETQFNLAFWPLYPLLIWCTNLVFNNLMLSALIVSTIASIVLALEFYRLVNLDESEDIALLSVIFLFIFPTSFFLHIGYTEALFLALVIGSFIAAREKRWQKAGLLASLATMTHINGVLLIPTLVVELLVTAYKQHRIQLESDMWYIFMPLVVIIGYSLFNHQMVGSYFNFISVENTHWAHTTVSPWQSIAGLVNLVYSYGPYDSQVMGVQGLIAIVIGAISTILSIFMLPLTYSTWMLANWLLITSQSWCISAARYMLSLFPMSILMARLFRQWPLAGLAIGIWYTIWQITLMSQFIAGHFVG